MYTSFLKSTTGFSLPDILFFEHLSHLIEHQPLVTGPERSHKKGLGTVTGQTVDDNVAAHTGMSRENPDILPWTGAGKDIFDNRYIDRYP